MQVSVHSDGVGGVIVTEDGKKIDGVRSATIWVEANEMARVDLTLTPNVVNIKGRLVDIEMGCPGCGDTITHTCDK